MIDREREILAGILMKYSSPPYQSMDKTIDLILKELKAKWMLYVGKPGDPTYEELVKENDKLRQHPDQVAWAQMSEELSRLRQQVDRLQQQTGPGSTRGMPQA